MSLLEPDSLAWRKSTRSGSGNCVEVAASSQHIYIRDSKTPHGPVLVFTLEEWASFLSGVFAGEFVPERL